MKEKNKRQREEEAHMNRWSVSKEEVSSDSELRPDTHNSTKTDWMVKVNESKKAQLEAERKNGKKRSAVSYPKPRPPLSNIYRHIFSIRTRKWEIE